MAWEGLNRRKFPRVNFPCMVIVKSTHGEEDILLTHTENIGTGGLCVTLKKSFKMFTPVVLELDLLDAGKHIRCNGKVCWSIRRKMDDKKKPLFYDIGIEFLDLGHYDHQRIVESVTRLAKKASYSFNE